MNDFQEQKESIGSQVNLEENSSQGRLAKMYFQKLLFQYFEELNSGQTGGGMNFLVWLEIFWGWKHLQMHQFQRVTSINDE